MNKYAIVLAMLAVLPSALAMQSQLLCQGNGYDATAAAWHWTESGFVLDGTERPGYDTSVTGDEHALTWTSNKRIQGTVLIGDGPFSQTADEKGHSGTVSTDGAITTIALCVMTDDSPSEHQFVSDERIAEEPLEVPEFGLVAGVLAGIAGLGLIVFRRQ